MIDIVCTASKNTRYHVRAMSIFVACTNLMFFIITISGIAEAATYGEIYVTSANASQWSTNLSNNVSIVTGDINVASGTLDLTNTTIKMNLTSNGQYKIDVANGAVLNLADNSNVTAHNINYKYNWLFQSGSGGTLADSTIEYCGYDGGSYGLKIETDSMIIDNLSIRYNYYGIFLSSSDNTVITNTNVSDSYYGIYLSASHNNNLTNNKVTDSSSNAIFLTSSNNNSLRSNVMENSSDYNLYVTGDYDQDIDTSNTVNGGVVYYNYTDSDVVITDNNIGHITIIDGTNLWFDSSTIHNGDGIRIRGSSSNVSIRYTTIENNTMYGINFESSSWNNITSVIIRDNKKQGIYLDGSSNNAIEDSNILNNYNYGNNSLFGSKGNDNEKSFISS